MTCVRAAFVAASAVFGLVVSGCGGTRPEKSASPTITAPQEELPESPQDTIEAMQAAVTLRDYQRFCQCFTADAQELMAGSFVKKSKLMLMMAPNSPEWVRRRRDKAKDALTKHGLDEQDIRKIPITFKRDEEERRRTRALAAQVKDHGAFIADMMAAEDMQPEHKAMPDVDRLEDSRIEGEAATLTLVCQQDGTEKRYTVTLRKIADKWRIDAIASAGQSE